MNTMNTNETLQQLQHEQAELEQAIADTDCEHELAYIKSQLDRVSDEIREIEG